jgi:putative DNA primase/helicase
LLSISGEDSPSIPRKYKDDWDGTLSVRFLVLTNELPKIEDASGALTSRFVILALTRSFYGKEDHGLLASLLPELPGILNWALVGRDRLYKRGHFVPPSSEEELVLEFENLGSPMAAFLRDRCEVGQGFQEEQGEMFLAWGTWCKLNGRDRAGTAQTFGKSLRAAIPYLRVSRPTDDGDRVRYYEGVKLRTLAGLENIKQSDLKLS